MKRRSKHRSWMTLTMTAALALALNACGGGSSDKQPQSTPTPGGGSQAASPAPSSAATEAPGATTTKQWSEPPKMAIDKSKKYEAVVETNKGSFTISLLADTAPETVNSFVFLAKENYFENIKFHRIMKGFMIQTGDPKGNGRGGPGYKLKDELDPKPKYELGTVAMANAGKNTAGSQFFVCVSADCGGLDNIPNYTVFGKVSEGMDNVLKIAETPVTVGANNERSKPTENVWIKKVTVNEK